MKIKSYVADFLLVLIAIVWGVTFLPVQKTVNETPVFIYIFYRFLVSTSLMGIFTIKHLKKADKVSIVGGVVLGIFLFSGFAFQTFGLLYTYSSTVAFITGLNVVIVPIFGYCLFKILPSKYSIGGAVVAVVGLYFLSASELGFGLGELLSFICAIMFAGQIAFTGVYVQKCNIFVLVFFQFLTVMVLSFIFALIVDGGIDVKFSSDFVYTVIITAVFATVFAFFVQTFMQKFTTATKTAIIFTLEPVSAGIMGYFYAGELLSSLQIFGAGLIIFGVLFAEIGSNLFLHVEKRK